MWTAFAPSASDEWHLHMSATLADSQLKIVRVASASRKSALAAGAASVTTAPCLCRAGPLLHAA
jgi:hypothetical protein